MNGTTVSTQTLMARTTRASIFSLGCICAATLVSAAPVKRVAPVKPATPVIAAIKMPQGAFLRSPAPDVAHLVAEVKADPSVAIRYSRLFHLPVKMVPLAFEQLRLKKLTNDHIMQVHFVRAGDKVEKLVYKPRRVLAGTPVYCLPDGTPLLVRVCGNPIRSRVAPESYSSIPTPDFDASETLTPVPTSDSSTDANAPGRVVIAPPLTPLDPVTLVDAEAVLPPASLPIAPSLPPEVLRAASLPPVYAWTGGPTGLFGLAGLPAALLPFISMGSKSAPAALAIVPPITTPTAPIGATPASPTGSTTPPGDGTTTLPPPVLTVPLGGPITDVPEPGLVALGAALLLMGASGLSRRRRSHRSEAR